MKQLENNTEIHEVHQEMLNMCCIIEYEIVKAILGFLPCMPQL
jgi:hypothetical protein